MLGEISGSLSLYNTKCLKLQIQIVSQILLKIDQIIVDMTLGITIEPMHLLPNRDIINHRRKKIPKHTNKKAKGKIS